MVSSTEDEQDQGDVELLQCVHAYTQERHQSQQERAHFQERRQVATEGPLPVAFEFYAIAGRDQGVRQFLKEYYATYQGE
ncbi:MAG: hypothetical protein NVS4B11_05730 [Ktedonobacteraceae bacterium]